MTDNRTAPHGALVLRTGLGVMFVSHAYLKFAVFTVPGFEGYLVANALPAMLAWPIILAELIGGLAILAGFYGRFVSLALIPLLLGALSVHASNGRVFNVPNGGWEYPAFLAAVALVHGLIGDGAFAIRTASLDSTRQIPGGTAPTA
jgi:putative oxidoreductase